MRKGLIIAVMLLALALSAWTLFAPEEAPERGEIPNAADLGLLLLEEDGQVVVLGVNEDSPAAMAGFEPGDRILSTDGAHVGSVEELEASFLRLEQQEKLPLMVRRDAREKVVLLPVR